MHWSFTLDLRKLFAAQHFRISMMHGIVLGARETFPDTNTTFLLCVFFVVERISSIFFLISLTASCGAPIPRNAKRNKWLVISAKATRVHFIKTPLPYFCKVSASDQFLPLQYLHLIPSNCFSYGNASL